MIKIRQKVLTKYTDDFTRMMEEQHYLSDNLTNYLNIDRYTLMSHGELDWEMLQFLKEFQIIPDKKLSKLLGIVEGEKIFILDIFRFVEPHILDYDYDKFAHDANISPLGDFYVVKYGYK